MKDEIVIYQPNEMFQLEVHVQDDSVWLNRQQMALLFDRDVKTIGKHINNALQEELKPDVAKFATTQNHEGNPVVSIFATTAADGKTYQVEYFNLDMILSVGYRVKSNRGVEFRRWANQVLKDYLLKGYVFNQRMARIENRLEEHAKTIAAHDEKLDFFIRTSLPPKEGVFFDGQMFDAYTFVSDLVRSAKQCIILIDNYVDDTVLAMLDKRGKDVKADIYTKTVNNQLTLDLQRHNLQYPVINVHEFGMSHDRFLIIDDVVYHIGASLKDLGRRWFAFSRMDDITAEFLINRLSKQPK